MALPITWTEATVVDFTGRRIAWLLTFSPQYMVCLDRKLERSGLEVGFPLFFFF
jgi:hypothetical protein